MFRRRILVLLKENIPSGISEVTSAPSIGRRILRTAIIGGLAGGLLGAAIEMTPEDYGIKKRVNDAVTDARKLFETPTAAIPDKPLVVSKPRTLPSPPPVKEEKKREEPKPVEVKEEVPRAAEINVPVPEPVAEPDSTESQSVENHPIVSEENVSVEISSTQEELSPESVPIEPSPEPVMKESFSESLSTTNSTTDEKDDDPYVREFTTPSIPEEVVTPPIEDPNESRIILLQTEIDRLSSELEAEKFEHEKDLARAAGSTQASLETIDRMFNEREVAMSVARQSLLVTELLYQLARDEMNLSPGSLKVDFERRKETMIESCFLPETSNFLDLILSRVFALLYSSTAGRRIATLGDDDLLRSPTWKNLRAVHFAEEAIERSDFQEAMNFLNSIRNVSDEAAQWADKTRQALELWQGSTAALASMHDELSRVI